MAEFLNLNPSTDEEYQRIIANEGSHDDEEDLTKEAILQFLQADTDGSGSMSLKEYIELSRQNQGTARNLFPAAPDRSMASRLDMLEAKVDSIAEKVDRLCEELIRPNRKVSFARSETM